MMKTERTEASKKKIAACERAIQRAERKLKEAWNAYYFALASDDEIEEIARTLWEWYVRNEAENEGDRDNGYNEEFLAELSDHDKRNAMWFRLTIKSEREEWRDKAKRLREIIQERLW